MARPQSWNPGYSSYDVYNDGWGNEWTFKKTPAPKTQTPDFYYLTKPFHNYSPYFSMMTSLGWKEKRQHVYGDQNHRTEIKCTLKLNLSA